MIVCCTLTLNYLPVEYNASVLYSNLTVNYQAITSPKYTYTSVNMPWELSNSLPLVFSRSESTYLPKPKKPLKILTIDGGGLQAISTLIILDKLLDTIAQNNIGVVTNRPRPCDVFDTIAGIGAGGWLAILLGRFHLDITACLSEWYNITHCIAPRSKGEELRMRVFQHCYFDTDRLIEQVDKLIEVYGTDEFLYYKNNDGPRCSHVFVAALKTNAKSHHLGYNLFRTYKCPRNAKLLDGPENPEKYKISHAFAATGAAKYFTLPWKERKMNGSKTKFSNIKFPNPHNITELALDEMWALYGKDVPISIVVNIGPGLPDDLDIKQIARRFSWGLNLATADKERNSSSNTTPVFGEISQGPSPEQNQDNDFPRTSEGPHIQLPADSIQTDPTVGQHSQHERKPPLNKMTTFGSEHNRDIDEKIQRLESQIEKDIRIKLKNIYPKDTPPYYRLALDKAPRGTVKNDACAPGVAIDATVDYVDSPPVENRMHEIRSVCG